MRLRQLVDVLSAAQVSKAPVVRHVDLHEVLFTRSVPAKMANGLGALGAACFGHVTSIQGNGFLAINGTMLVCDIDAKLGAIYLRYDVGAC